MASQLPSSGTTRENGSGSAGVARDRSRSPAGQQGHFNVGPAESALGFRAEVVDSHAYVLSAFDAANGVDRAEKLRRLQLELGTHHTFAMQTGPGPRRYVDNSSLVDPLTLALQPGVEWSRDELGRPCWEVDGRRFVKGNCPPSVQTQANAFSIEQLVAAMDFADVSTSVLHYYPTFGDLNPLHREACLRFPARFRRLIHFPDLNREPQNMGELLEQVDAELATGGVAGLQFFTGWFDGDWDSDSMRPFWDHLAARRVAVWFTCVLGHPKQFSADADTLFAEDYDKLIAWCGRYPHTDVVLTHGLPWRSYLQNVDPREAAVPPKLLKVFECPRVHVQLLIPLRIGDIFDFPFQQANSMLNKFARAVGVDRLLYGTDMPMVERYCTYSQSVLHIARYCDFLSPQERALVLGGNARRLLDRADAAMKACSPHRGLVLAPPLSDTLLTARLPAVVGQQVDSLGTPCLIIDLDAFEENCATMNKILRAAAANGILLRPHTKPHKSSMLAQQQLKLHGDLAQGVCCQTVREAEAMVRGGVLDVLLTNIIANLSQAHRLARLSAFQGAKVGICIDSCHVLQLAKDALRALPGAQFDVMLEIGVACRTGVEPEATATTVALAKDIAGTAGLRLRGLQVYHGVAQHLRTSAERGRAISEAAAVARRHLAALEEAGVPGPGAPKLVVSGGGTGSLPFEAESGVYGELQCGSYIFNDTDYARNGEQAAAWRQSLFVLGTVLGSYGRPGAVGGPHSVVDVGLKAVAFDSGAPVPLPPAGDGPPMEYVNLGDEHGAIRAADGGQLLAAGTRIRHIPGHCDPTVNLHDFLIGVRGGAVERIFPVDARGY